MNNKFEYFVYFWVEYIREISIFSCCDFKEIEIFVISFRLEIFLCIILLYINVFFG